ncbi:peroxidase-related enzyme [Gillisia limnaea]|uniref:Putative peroxidase-related enzyme n=1 Tax=Gillisia limnaea (strain DSM 15749 / LMG 21470 / R-8282) TaxID=865937 RepID=H2BW22_GILLR|nr:peroxidase-related enzyme [Gillisia limnaea]EHQ02939.1 putative peroxidase-related enzyme [Gillisia limnaea DSM 15749]
MSRISIIQPAEATGRLKEIYEQLEKQRGQIAEVHKIQSLRPESIVKHMELYMEIMFCKSELSRAQREMIAVVVSMANNCSYCATHHGSALHHYWKDEEKLRKLRANYREVDISGNDMALCQYAEEVTLRPQNIEEVDPTAPLREIGFSDAAILDTTLVVAYFNFVNRMVLSLGVEIEQDGGANYKY